jgi:hypothetical protein
MSGGGARPLVPIYGLQVIGKHAYEEENSYTFTVTVTEGGSTHVASGTATVADAPLHARLTLPSVPTEGAALQGPLATFHDDDPHGIAGDYTATISWGDGSPDSAGTIQAQGGDFVVLAPTGGHT